MPCGNNTALLGFQHRPAFTVPVRQCMSDNHERKHRQNGMKSIDLGIKNQKAKNQRKQKGCTMFPQIVMMLLSLKVCILADGM